MPRSPLHCLAVALLCAACVSTSTHEKGLADLNAQHEKELEATKAEDASKLSDLERSRKDLEANSPSPEAGGRAEQALAGHRRRQGQARPAPAASNSQLEDLSKQKAAADARAATYKSLTDKLRSMIDAGKLSVKIRKGRMLIPSPTTCSSTRGAPTSRKPAGTRSPRWRRRWRTSAPAVLVAGHTDDKPIRTPRFPSNWELSTDRAVVVTRFLIGKGMKPDSLGAVGYGEFDPVFSNDSDDTGPEPADRDPAPAQPERAAVDERPGERLASVQPPEVIPCRSHCGSAST